MNKIRPVASIVTDDWEGKHVIVYRCTCGKYIQEKQIACAECGTLFDWSQTAHIKVIRQIMWE